MIHPEQEHDQLPSVESYKANMRVNGIQLNPPTATTVMGGQHPKVPELETFPSHDLPNVEEYKVAHPSISSTGGGSGSSVWWKSTTCLMMTMLFLVLCLIVAITVPLKQHKDNSERWWLHHSDRYEDIQAFVVQNRISTLSDLQDPSSPQHKAAKWLANKDGMHMTVPPPLEATSSTAFIERYVLAVFYFATGGPDWTQSLNFMSSEHVCTWYGLLPTTSVENSVKDDGDYLTLGIHACKLVDEELVPLVLFLRKWTKRIHAPISNVYSTNRAKPFFFLFFSLTTTKTANNNLVGSLPLEMSFLDRLEILNLSYNPRLTGQLPFWDDGMDLLRHVELQSCGFNSTIPESIEGFQDLTYLGLGNNMLTGKIPDGLLTLPHLEWLNLDDNTHLHANIERFSTLTKIRYLYLQHNQIMGTLSNSLLTSWPDLVEMDVSHNQLGGSLPNNLFTQLNSAQVLDLSHNEFTGKVPVPQWEISELTFVALNDNQLHGTVPARLAKLKGLTHLDVSGNNFEGVLPTEIGTMTLLEYLYVGNNPYVDNRTNVIPTLLRKLTNLKELSFKSSRLHGDLPAFVGSLTNLQVLDFRT